MSADIYFTPQEWGHESINMQNNFHAYIRHSDGTISDETNTQHLSVASVAYKHLLFRADLRANKPLAILELNGEECINTVLDGKARFTSVYSALCLKYSRNPNYNLPSFDTRIGVLELYDEVCKKKFPQKIPNALGIHNTAMELFLAIAKELEYKGDDAILRATKNSGWCLTRSKLNSWYRKNDEGYYIRPIQYDEIYAILECIREEESRGIRYVY